MRSRLTVPRALATVLAVGLCVVLVLPASAGAVVRSTVLARALSWVEKKVPYSQSRYATVEGALVPTSTVRPYRVGYRTDCSGFVSMCLALKNTDGTPLSLTTASLPSRLTTITKVGLLPGDVICRRKDLVINGKTVPYGHALIFGGWTDATKKYYVAYDESGSSKGTIKHVVKYPFWSEPGFYPYRYRSITDAATKKVAPKLSSARDLSTGLVVPIGK